ncbi:copper chaperone [Thalassospira sp. MBR-102]|jgi:copper chaperone|uniref:Heavy metal transporter n=3 Tax=Thalassospira TaxID=168934 RepID=A0A154W9L3_9PROT|nr:MULTISPECIES: heavy metal-associated domain-containing protein [Thalassospira]MBR9779898.1 heavy-metal-associated domain-containing protein [Rhodospirillales bacterium]UKV16406.1 heavy-metal-associated domain-containing protein [Thalassospiraceae bacterium SW-3-3]AJD51920.1 Copper chaperone [Thalassospira xiamenensis M-5 = DSM 17429]KEO59149.1 heavy metal transporter [Thalassospira permensis NBRC 106175]KZB54444.1 heavy metal transporter [Thalassospira xiamenensis]|tara:strand:+ start:89 stop:289 length:201 start_codon:yes stop_codon:yes gene_type:complete
MLKLKVDEMSCGHCAATVTKAVEGVSGVEKADIDLAKGEVTVTGNPDVAALIAAIDDAGYPARELA